MDEDKTELCSAVLPSSAKINLPHEKSSVCDPLMELPPELRAMIWKDCIVSEDKVLELNPSPRDLSTIVWAPPPLTRVSRAIRNETLAMFFANHVFLFSTHGLGPCLPILRRALTFLKLTNPGVRLDTFKLRIKGHMPLCMEDLVEYARIFGTFAAQLPIGPVPLLGLYQKDCAMLDSYSPISNLLALTGVVRARQDFASFLQDLADVGHSLQDGSPFSYTRYKDSIEGMFTEPGIERDHFRRWIIQDWLIALETTFKGARPKYWVHVVRSRGDVEAPKLPLHNASKIGRQYVSRSVSIPRVASLEGDFLHS